MVCKEDVVSWFKELRGHKRIDVMCSLLNMCLPFELRYLGTCLEDLGKRDFLDLRDAENRANNVTELTDLQCISDKRTQRKLALYLSLLQSSNHACSNGLYKILVNLDFSDINLSTDNPDDNPLDELLLLYTLAINHPAFTYEQKLEFGNILLHLQDEENKLYASKHPVNIGLVYVKPPIQPCVPTNEDRQQDVGVISHCATMPLHSNHPSANNADLKGRNIGTPIGMTPTIGLPPPEQLGGYVHVAFPSQPLQWHHAATTPMVMCEVPPDPSSPLVSRQSSPSQSGSPSRAGSPAAQPRPPVINERGSQQNFKIPPQRRPRQNCVDGSIALGQRSVSRKGSAEPLDGLRETLGKEMPTFVSNLQNYSIDELRRMSDEELKEIGLPTGAINQLRSIVTKLSATNGLSNLDKREMRRKPEALENEIGERKGTHSATLRRYGGPLDGAPMMYPPPPLMAGPPPCYTCITVPVSSAAAARFHNHQHGTPAGPFYCLGHGIRSLTLEDGRSNSSGGASSDSSSNGHSPPDTPSMPNAPHWSDRGYTAKETSVGERWSPGCEDRQDKDRIDKLDDNSAQSLRRVPTGVSRGGKGNNPPGVQTLPRGRGPNPATVIMEGATGHKGLPACRQQRNDGGAVNGGPPQLVPYPPSSSPQYPPPPRPGDNVPYPPLVPGHFPGLRQAGTIFPGYGSFPALRPSFPFSHNGELVYQYHTPQNPPPPPPAFLPTPVVYSTVIPPPKVSCYNCGSQSHHATDCKEATMEEISKPGQYRLDYAPYQKPGECSSEK